MFLSAANVSAMQSAPVHPKSARRYLVLALEWDRPLLDAFVGNMQPRRRTNWAAWSLRMDNLELLRKMDPELTENPVYNTPEGGWLVGGCRHEAYLRSIQYKIPLRLVDGKVWISRWVGPKRSRLAEGMSFPNAIEFDLEGLKTLDQVASWFIARGVLGCRVEKTKATYRLGQLEVETRLSHSSHRVRVSRTAASSDYTLATVDYRLYWDKTMHVWERRVVAGQDIVEVFDEESSEKFPDRRMIFQMMELMAGINPS